MNDFKILGKPKIEIICVNFSINLVLHNIAVFKSKKLKETLWLWVVFLVFFKVFCETETVSQNFPTVFQNTAETRFATAIKIH